ncbi:MAG TPA: Ig-like domain-containing protein, partial [Prolixibacteraceae bacterium]|nr:Ig-like domain-containing protein [Prolixibacteraceae bacterium]
GLKATNIIISQHKAELVSGNTTKLIAFPLPALAEDQKILWSSSDAGIASVDANGLVTAVASRDASAVITAKTSDGGFTATCEVKVLASAAKIAYPDGNPHKIPGIIQVTHYDRGGEGVGYHDLTPANDGDGIRKNEGVDTGVLIAEGNIGGIGTGEWLEYTVEVLQEGNYTFELLFATAGRYGKFRIEMNGVDQTGRLSVIPSGSYSKFVTTRVPGIKLEKGVQVMRIFFDYAEYNLGPVTITREIPSGDKELVAHKKINIYPSPTDGKLFVSGIEKGKIYSIINVYGQVLQSGIISEFNTFDVTSLDAGNYIIRIESNKECLTERFVKL